MMPITTLMISQIPDHMDADTFRCQAQTADLLWLTVSASATPHGRLEYIAAVYLHLWDSCLPTTCKQASSKQSGEPANRLQQVPGEKVQTSFPV